MAVARFSKDAEVAALLAKGDIPAKHIAAMVGVSPSVVWRVRDQELGKRPGPRPFVSDFAARNDRILELSESIDRDELARMFNLSKSGVGVAINSAKRRAGIEVPPGRNIRGGRRRVESQPAPIKRPKRPKKREPLFFTCSKKHPITRSNLVKGAEKGCVLCAKKGLALDPRMAVLRDRQIHELSLIVQAEVAALTADLRPEEEKAA